MNLWQDRFVKREHIKAGELAKRFNVKNHRIHTEAQNSATGASLEKLGWIDEVSLSTNGDGPTSLDDNTGAVLFDGHERVEIVLSRFGPDEDVPAKWYQLSKPETDAALRYKDATAALAEIDLGKLAEFPIEMEFQIPEVELSFGADSPLVLGEGDFVEKNNRSGSSPWDRIEPSNKTRCLIGDIEFGVDKDVVKRWFQHLRDTGDDIRSAAEKWFIQHTL